MLVTQHDPTLLSFSHYQSLVVITDIYVTSILIILIKNFKRLGMSKSIETSSDIMVL